MTKKETAQEVPVQEQLKITYEMGVMERARFFISTDEKMYNIIMKNPKAVSLFTPENIKESLGIQQDLQIYLFYILEA